MKKTVILSSNNNPDYLSYLPYTQQAWNKLGWNTLTFYLGPDTIESTPENIVIGISQAGSYRIESCVQVMRLLAGNYIQDGMIMIGDVDMIPLANYWHSTVDHITVYGFDLTGYSEYPMCYIAMTADRWREIMPEQSLLDLLDKIPNAKSDDFYKWWGIDQQVITERINTLKRPDELVLVDRGKTGDYAKGRIDRGAWERTFNSDERKIDAHMLRPFNLEETEKVMKLIQA